MNARLLRGARVLITLGWVAATQIVAAASPDLGFELPKLDGTAFVRMQDHAGRPLLLNFWGSDCPPCIAEMPMLFSQAKMHPEVQFLGIAVDQRAQAMRFLRQMHATYPQLIALNQPEVLLRRFGNPSGALPYTVIMNERHVMCATHAGAIDEKWLTAAISACSAH
jgi:thiol-disulfide isomerase/thioredoxin